MFYECDSPSPATDENITHLSREVNVSHKVWQIETNVGSHMIYGAHGLFVMDMICIIYLFIY